MKFKIEVTFKIPETQLQNETFIEATVARIRRALNSIPFIITTELKVIK